MKTMKIPLQEKIAELETRIKKLEDSQKELKSQSVTWTSNTAAHSGHWKKMWYHFGKIFE